MSERMRRVVARGGEAVVESVAAPSLPAKGYLIAGECSLISAGTELMTIAASADGRPARPLGYSLVGRVLASGPEAPPLPTGQRVTCAGFQWAWHAEQVAVPFRMTTVVPTGVPAEAATFTTLGALALHALRQGEITIGDRAVVIGLGVVGQVLAQTLLAAGADVCALDLLASRRRKAADLGVPLVLGAPDDDPATIVREWSAGFGADTIFLCTAGGEGLVELACAMARDRGRIVIVGTPPIHVPRDPFFARELTLTIARAYGPGRYDPVYEEEGIDYPVGYVRWTQERNRIEFLRLLDRSLVQVQPLISHRFDLTEAAAAYRLLEQAPESAIGVLFVYEGSGRS
jgi:threonine dehydrogenase-like Zn-dependent dehydrogenase